MKRSESFLETLAVTKIISVVRIHGDTDLVPLMRALYEGGVKIIEITSTTPHFDRSIAAIRAAFSEQPDVFVGAGTILRTKDMEAAMAAQADFIVSPVLDHAIVAACVAHDIPVMPGAMTPTEISAAWNAGASVVKTFPGRVCTPDFYRDMRGPFPSIRMMPTGNVNTTTAPAYIAAGAIAVGVGKDLASEASIMAGDWKTIRDAAARYIQLLSSVRA